MKLYFLLFFSSIFCFQFTMGDHYKFTSEEISATYTAEGINVKRSFAISESNTDLVTMDCTVVGDSPSGLVNLKEHYVARFLKEMIATDERSRNYEDPADYHYNNDDKKVYQCTSPKATDGPIVVVAYKVTIDNKSGQQDPYTLTQTYKNGEQVHYEDYILLQFNFK